MSTCTSFPSTICTHELLDSTVVVPSGEIDLESRDRLRASLDGVHGDVIVDLADVELLDASGMGVLAGARHRLLLAGGSLVLHGPRPSVRRALTSVGLEAWIAA